MTLKLFLSTYSNNKNTSKLLHFKKTQKGIKMSDANVEDMLTPSTTTYLADYHKTEITAPIKTEYKAKPRCIGIRKGLLKDVHTMCEWQSFVPFDLLHHRRIIVQTDPRKVQQPFSNPVDDKREEAQQSRPRLVMTPAVSMDDITDERARSLLCGDMYSSAVMRAQRESAGSWANERAPLPGLPAPSNPITLAKLQFPYVSPEWRMDTVRWDGRQLRAHCDATKEFWLQYPLPECKPCDETAIIEENRKMRRQQR